MERIPFRFWHQEGTENRTHTSESNTTSAEISHILTHSFKSGLIDFSPSSYEIAEITKVKTTSFPFLILLPVCEAKIVTQGLHDKRVSHRVRACHDDGSVSQKVFISGILKLPLGAKLFHRKSVAFEADKKWRRSSQNSGFHHYFINFYRNLSDSLQIVSKDSRLLYKAINKLKTMVKCATKY